MTTTSLVLAVAPATADAPRQAMTTARLPFFNPPSRISSQPTIRRPLAVRCWSILRMNSPCRRQISSWNGKPWPEGHLHAERGHIRGECSLASCSIRGLHFAQARHEPGGTSSAPTWIYGDGNNAITSSSTCVANSNVGLLRDAQGGAPTTRRFAATCQFGIGCDGGAAVARAFQFPARSSHTCPRRS